MPLSKAEELELIPRPAFELPHHAEEHRKLGVRRNPRNTAAILQFTGRHGAAATANVTRHMGIKLPEFCGARTAAFCFANAASAAGTVNGIYYSRDDMGDTIHSDVALGVTDLTWQKMTLGYGVDNDDIPVEAEHAINGHEIASLNITDSIPTAKLGKYLFLRSWKDTHNTRGDGYFTFTPGPSGTLATHGLMACTKNGANGVAVPSAFVSPAYGVDMPGISIIIGTDLPVYCILKMSGSAGSGLNDEVAQDNGPGAGLGDIGRVLHQSFLDRGKRISMANGCISTSIATTAYFATQLDVILASKMPYDAIILRYTAGDDKNEPDYAAGELGNTLAAYGSYMNRIMGQADIAARKCSALGVHCGLDITPYPVGMAGVEYEVHKLLTQHARNLRDEGLVFLFDGPELYNDENAPVGTQKYAGYHPSPTSFHRNGYGARYTADKVIKDIRSRI